MQKPTKDTKPSLKGSIAQKSKIKRAIKQIKMCVLIERISPQSIGR
jgi:hypothetical protein